MFFGSMAAAAVFLWKEVAIPPMVAVGYAETNIANVAAPLPGSSRSVTATPGSSLAEPEAAAAPAKRGEDRPPASRLRALALRLEARRSSIFADRS
jgi:hypothetical protein